MDGITLLRQYVDRISHGDNKCEGMKVLLLDTSTAQILSCVYSQTEILSQQVYLVSNLDDRSAHSKQSHLNAVVFIRPTDSSIDNLAKELNKPRFAEYHIFLSGIVTGANLRKLASADVTERVRQVQEMYADFLPMNADLWTLQQRSLAMSVAAGTSWAQRYAVPFNRNVQGLQGMLLAIKKQPSCIRYAAHSPAAEELARELHESIQGDDIFHFRRHPAQGGLQVLILDRRDDPVTPLLSQWTYQAMVHELLGLNNHRVVLKGAPNIAKDLEEVVLSATQDEFFRDNRFKNFGELGEEVQRLLREYQQQSAQHSPTNLNTIEEMQTFMERFPELKSRSHVVSKHVAIMGELARLVEVCSLMDVSQFEQQLACDDDQNNHWRELLSKLESREIKIPDKLRLGLLFALRYEVSGNIHMLQSAMAKGGVPAEMVQLVPVMLRYAGSQSRGPGLFGDNHHIMAKMTKSLMTSVQGVENVYSQHIPLVMDTLLALCKGKLSVKTHPIVQGSTVSANINVPDQVLIYMVGGITYEEGTKIHEFNAEGKGPRVILAGSTVHNSTSFLDELRSTDQQ